MDARIFRGTPLSHSSREAAAKCVPRTSRHVTIRLNTRCIVWLICILFHGNQVTVVHLVVVTNTFIGAWNLKARSSHLRIPQA
jgi:hypothetical protein